MTRFLVDTNVISELAPGRKAADARLLNWLAAREEHLFLSVITAIEIRSGIVKMQRLSPGLRQREIAAWYESLEVDFGDRVLPLTRHVVEFAAAIADRNAASGLHPGWPDVMIAATAAFHELTVLTRNTRHFAATGVAVVDPFQSNIE